MTPSTRSPHATQHLLEAIGTDVAEGPDPFADPVTRRAILAAGRPGRRASPGRPPRSRPTADGRA